jgi:hypothetical protein
MFTTSCYLRGHVTLDCKSPEPVYFAVLCSLYVSPSNSPNLCSVCGGDTTLMYHGRDVHGWVRQLDESPSTCRWSVEVYISQVPHQGATVVFGYIEVSCEHYDPNIYRFILT